MNNTEKTSNLDM